LKSYENNSQKKVFDKVIGDKTTNVEEVNIENEEKKTPLLTDKLSKHSRNERKLVSKILSIIDTVLVKELAENLKQKIIEEMNK
jgi:hypothetical protein